MQKTIIQDENSCRFEDLNCVRWCSFPQEASSQYSCFLLLHIDSRRFRSNLLLNLIMVSITSLLPLILVPLRIHAQTCTTLQPIFELPLDATSTAFSSTATSTSSVDCGSCSLVVSTFRAVVSTPVPTPTTTTTESATTSATYVRLPKAPATTTSSSSTSSQVLVPHPPPQHHHCHRSTPPSKFLSASCQPQSFTLSSLTMTASQPSSAALSTHPP